MMTMLNENDPRLTAYALGELDASEASVVEAALRGQPSLSNAVEQIRAAARLVSSELASEPALQLTPEQLARIRQRPAAAASSRPPLVFRARPLWAGIGLAAVACLGFAIYLSWPGPSNDPASTLSGGFAKKEHEVAPQNFASETGAAGGPGAAGETGELRASRSVAPSEKLAEADKAAAQPVERKDQSNMGTGAPKPSAALDKTVGSPPPPPPGHAAPGGKSEPDAAPETSRRIGGGSAPAPVTASPPRPEAAPSADSAGLGGGGRGKDRGGEGARAASPAAASPRDASKSKEADTRLGQDDRAAGRLRDDERPGNESRDQPQPDLVGDEERQAHDNPFLKTLEHPNPTFSVDVDTASYASLRGMIEQGQTPPRDQVRIEEMLNYFRYSYEPPTGDDPFSAAVEINQAPWNPGHRLVRIGIKGREVKLDMRPATSLVFLLDVSGSMKDSLKLPLVKEAMKLLVAKLNGDDRLAIVTYADHTRLLLDSTYCSDERKPEILAAIDGLQAAGATNGGGGIQQAYETAAKHFIKGGVNRVILCTDGDFNVGVSREELIPLIERKAKSGVFLSVIGVGKHDFRDAFMESLADKGNGNYAYFDRIEEAKKVLVDQMGGTLIAIAKDVKILMDFNPAFVGAYRLIGYEDRTLAPQDFQDDRKDAGEIGSGHTVTALFETIPPSEPIVLPQTPKSEFVDQGNVKASELFGRLKISYKEPDGDSSRVLSFGVKDDGKTLDAASADFRFAAAVAEFGMLLRRTPPELCGQATASNVLDLARGASEDDPDGYRSQFIKIVEKARRAKIVPDQISPPGIKPSLSGNDNSTPH